jgi:DnaJ-class molecular chaperone
MAGSGVYKSCATCGNVKEGTQVIRCLGCKVNFCKDCAIYSGSFFVKMICPNCGGSGKMFKYLGHISP